MKHCKEVYIENSKLRDWANEDVQHDFNGLEFDGEFTFQICTHCGGRVMKGVSYN
jgi:hypothetical protein